MPDRFWKFVGGLFLLGTVLFAITWFALPSAEDTLGRLQIKPLVVDRFGRPLTTQFGGAAVPEVNRGGVFTPIERVPECGITFTKELEGYSPLGVKWFSLPKCILEGRGCSTVTMQAARSLFRARIPEERLGESGASVQMQIMRLYRKWLEIVMASKLALGTAPVVRMEAFFNTAVFHPQRRGIGYASARFFGKSPAHLSCQQYLQLITLLSNPTRYKPAYRDEFLNRYHLRLNHLFEEDLISAAQREAWQNPPPFQEHPRTASPHAAAVDRAIQEVRRTLGSDHRLGEGLVIETSVNARVQARADSVLDKAVSRWQTSADSTHGTFVLMAPDGQYRGYVVNSARQAGYMDFIQQPLQMGSRAKVPIYALAIAVLRERGHTTQEIRDYSLPTRYVLRSDDGEKLKEIGSHCLKYGDHVSLRKALVESCNGSAYWLANELLSPQDISSFLRAFGIHVSPHKALPMGSFSVTEEDLVALYNGVLNTYRRVGPRIVSEIRGRNGRVIYNAPSSLKGTSLPLLVPEVSWMMRQLMREVVASGTAEAVDKAHPSLDLWDVLLKTGTSNGGQVRYRGVTGETGGFVMSLTLRGKVPLPSAPYSAVPVAGGVLNAVNPILSQ